MCDSGLRREEAQDEGEDSRVTGILVVTETSSESDGSRGKKELHTGAWKNRP